MQKLTAKLKVWDPDTWVGSTEILTQLQKGNMSQRKPPPLWRPCMLWVTLWDRRPHPLKDSQQFQNGCRQPLRKQDEENNEHWCICFRNTLDYLRCCRDRQKRKIPDTDMTGSARLFHNAQLHGGTRSENRPQVLI